MFTLGLVVNPLAGIGGAVGLKGSDGAGIVAEALQKGAKPKAALRASQALSKLLDIKGSLRIYTYEGDMGGRLVGEMGFDYRLVGKPSTECTLSTAEDTIAAALAIKNEGVDLLLFVGGDGTARNICEAVGLQLPVLGVPAGVKMHSSVYAVSPFAAGEMLHDLISGGLVNINEREVRDIDEVAFRNNIVKARHYGELLVPEIGRYLQQVKCGGLEVDALVLEDIAASIIDTMEDDVYYIVGPGSTTLAILDALGLESTLLGVDVICNQEIVQRDVTEQDLLGFTSKTPCKIIITAIGGQGHILGRGNQQISSKVLRAVGIENIEVIATHEKMDALEGRPLLVDTGDADLDAELSGLVSVTIGYENQIIYRVSAQ